VHKCLSGHRSIVKPFGSSICISWTAAALLVVGVYSGASGLTDLQPGVPVNGSIPGDGVAYYRVRWLEAGQDLFVKVDKPIGGLLMYVAIQWGSQPSSWGVSDSADQLVQFQAPAAGDTYIRLDCGPSGGSFTITAHTHNTLDTINPGDPPLTNQGSTGYYDVRWYQVPVQANQELFVEVSKPVDGLTTWVAIQEGTVPDYGGSAAEDQLVQYMTTAAGWAYIRLDYQSAGSVSIRVHTHDTLDTIHLDDPPLTNQNAIGYYDVRWYQVPVQANQELFVEVSKPVDGLTTWVAIQEGTVPDYGGSATEDQLVQYMTTAAGWAYIRVDYQSAGSVTIRVHTHNTLDTIHPGDPPLTNQSSIGYYDVRWYQVPVRAGQRLFVQVHKETPGLGTWLAVQEGAIPGYGSYDTADQEVKLTATAVGYVYIRLDYQSAGSVSVTVLDKSPTVTASANPVYAYEGRLVSLTSTGTSPEGKTLTYRWIQTKGKSVTISGATSRNASFTAPTLTTRTDGDMAFLVTVKDSNNSTGSTTVGVMVYPKGDATHDYCVDGSDVLALASSWGKGTGNPGFDPACDFNSDGKVDVSDLLVIAKNWGRCY
jgi:hypothetical protein